MSYECCNPGCKNVLKPLKPLSAVISAASDNYNLQISLSDDMIISASSINEIRGLLSDTYYQNHELVLSVTDELEGAKGNFNIQAFKLSIPGTKFNKTASGQLTVCCLVCSKCCRVNY